MSSEGKKKRGVAGKSNAESSPFRLNGMPPDWMARKIGATHAPVAASGGSTTMRGILGGALVAAVFGMPMVGDYDRLIAHAAARCTSSYLTLPEDDQGTGSTARIAPPSEMSEIAEAA